MTKTVQTIKKQAIKQGVSSNYIANQLGVPCSTITRMMNGEREPSIELVERVVKVLNLKIKIEKY